MLFCTFRYRTAAHLHFMKTAAAQLDVSPMPMLSLTPEQRTYVSDEIRAQRARGWLLEAVEDRPDAMLLWGTIGYAAYLSLDGRVWIDEDFIEHPKIREAPLDEAIDALRKARERHPDLAPLIPPPPPAAVVCDLCRGLGRLGNPPLSTSVICGDCDARGWILPRTG